MTRKVTPPINSTKISSIKNLLHMPNSTYPTPEKTIVARWETRGKDFLELYRTNLTTEDIDADGNHRGFLQDYSYRGNGCGGGFFAKDDKDAISRMEAPWGDPQGVGQVTVLKSDRPSLRRVK